MFHLSPYLCVNIKQPTVTCKSDERIKKKAGKPEKSPGRGVFLLIGLQSTLRPPNRKRQLSDTAVRVCHDLPTGMGDDGVLENRFTTELKAKLVKHLLDI